MPVPQWTVEGMRGPHAMHVFEEAAKAMVYAASRAEAERPAIVTDPSGNKLAVFRLDHRVELSARASGAHWRTVIDPS